MNYYKNILEGKGLYNIFNVVTHDIYYTKSNLDKMSEYEIKNACIRLRSCNSGDYIIQNNFDKYILRKKR